MILTEEAARAWVRQHVSRETYDQLCAFDRLLREACEHQNLVSVATLPMLWQRHIVDSLQLLGLAPSDAGTWIDLGSGAGFPGMVIAIARDLGTTLVEARPLRADFLRGVASSLGLGARVTVIQSKVEAHHSIPADIISARAVAPLDRLLGLGHHLSSETTTWLLPKGKNGSSELEAARRSWQGEFRMEPSLTDERAGIIVATRVRPRRAGKVR